MKHLKTFEMLRYQNKKVVEVQDWDALVQEVYGKPYSFQQQEGCKQRGVFNISIPEDCEYADEEDAEMHDDIPFGINGDMMGVKFEKWLSTTEEEINAHHPEDYRGANRLFWARNFYPNVNKVAKDLYERGFIEPGSYSINIDW